MFPEFIINNRDFNFRNFVMQPSPKNSIKRAEIDNNKVIHALTMNNIDKYQSSLREEPPYIMYRVHKTR